MNLVAPQPAAGKALLAILGPTAVGKTALSLQLAQELRGEIVSADSRLFYRGMDIGTAKPTPAERRLVPHHLIDICDPAETIGLARFKALADQAIADVQRRGKLSLLVGGTGQYVRAVAEGWAPPAVPPNKKLRAEMRAEARQKGAQALHDRLAALDPLAAARIDARNVRRVIRALEVCQVTGQPFSAQRARTPPPYRILQIGLTMERQALYARVDARIEAMLAAGLEQEVQQLLKAGYGWELPAMSALGYIQFRPYFRGEATLEEAVQEIRRATRQFIRRQYNWFKLDDPHIHWFDPTKQAAAEIAAFVRQRLE